MTRVSFTACTIVLYLLLQAALRATEGVLNYTLDDPYIHLRWQRPFCGADIYLEQGAALHAFDGTLPGSVALDVYNCGASRVSPLGRYGTCKEIVSCS